MSYPEIRRLHADEIDARAAQVTEKGAVLLLYKDARVDMRILDETFGPMNWQKSYREIAGNLYCTISVWDAEKKQWIAKEDVGVESFSEAEKGQASDAQKRSGFAWGIGRELYTAPFIWVKAEDIKASGGDIAKNSKGKWMLKGVQPRVDTISYDAKGNIIALTISNKGKNIYTKVGGK